MTEVMNEEIHTEEKGKSLKDILTEAEGLECPVQRLGYVIEEFIAGPMCGKCFPCALGTAEARMRINRISSRDSGADASDISVLKRIGLRMMEGSLCKKGKDTGNYIIACLAASGDEFMDHVKGRCFKKQCLSLVVFHIEPELCTVCGKCLEVCRDNAILGEPGSTFLSGYLPFEIRQKRCSRCGACLAVCPSGAISANALEQEITGSKSCF
jgi:ferredoxin